MNPVQERRHGYQTVLITFWSVMAICIVVATGSLILAYTTHQTAKRAEAAHCVLVVFLKGSSVRNQQAIDKDPKNPTNEQRLDAIRQTARLVGLLEDTGIHCPQVSVLERKVKR